MLDQFFLADGSAAAEQQIFQNAASLSERQGLSVRRSGAAACVKCQPAAPQAHILLDEPAACQAAYPRLQLL